MKGRLLVAGLFVTTCLLAQPGLAHDSAKVMTLDELRDARSVVMKSGAALDSRVQKKAGWISQRLKREIGRYRISFSMGLNGEEIGGNEDLTGDAYYRVVIDPNYKDGQHIRRDTYVFGLGFHKYLQASTQVRLTFTRTFSGPKAKIDAIMALPYMIWRLPLNTDEFKSQLTTGDAVRLELLGRLGVGDSEGFRDGKFKGSASVSYAREALFMMDAYKHSETLARVRFLGVRNRGVIGIGVRTERPPFFSSLPRQLRRWFEVGLGADATTSLGTDQFPIESWVVDYAFRFNSKNPGPPQPDSAEVALDELLDEMRKFGFGSIFNPILRRESEDAWFRKASGVSLLAAQDQAWPKAARVHQIFKGRMRSSLTGYRFKMQVSDLLKGSAEHGFITSFVESELPDGSKQYHVLENSHIRSHGRALFGRHDDRVLYDTDFLIRSNAKGEILDTVDVVVRSESRGKELSGQELRGRASKMEHLLPAVLRGSGKVAAFVPHTDQHNARIVGELSFGQAALNALGGLSLGDVAVALERYLENHPDRYKMNLPCDQGGNTMISFGQVVEDYSRRLWKAFDGHVMEEQRWQAISSLQTDLLFQRWLLPEFVSSLLPGTNADSMVRLRVDFSSDETPTRQLELGSNAVSEVYSAAAFVRTVLATRDFDLRDETIREEQNGTLK